MRVISVNVGLPRTFDWQGAQVVTGIFKDAVTAPTALRRFNLDGDGQADLSVHGGHDKAIYGYPFEHYHDWQVQLGRALPRGAFGENLTTEGLLEDHVHIGDEFRVGTARLVVSQPRMPCFKLGLRFGDPRMTKTFLQARRPGIYFAVVEEGVVEPGAAIELLQADERRITVIDMLELILARDAEPERLRRVLEVPALAAVWREEFAARLEGAR